MMKPVYFILLFGLFKITICAKILAIFPVPSYSHYVLGSKIMKEMNGRGHDVTFVTYFKDHNVIPNWTEVVLENSFRKRSERVSKLHFSQKLSSLDRLLSVFKFNVIGTETIFKNKDFLNLLNNTYDIVVYDKFLSQIYTALGHHFKCPVVCMSTISSNIFTNFIVGNPHYSSRTSSPHHKYTPYMNLWERFINGFHDLCFLFMLQFYLIPKENEVLQQAIGPLPHLNELLYDVDLFLVNSHSSVNPAITWVPSMKEIGGAHIGETKKLPSEIQEYLDSATDGVVFMSMRSYLQTSSLLDTQMEAIGNFFGNISEKVLWTYKRENYKLPNNVKTVFWVSQQDVLAHKNVKVFISHCGALSVMETVYYGVPLLCIPIFGDQFVNADYASFQKISAKVSLKDLNVNNLKNAYNSLLLNPIYKENIKKQSNILKDNPVSPINTAIYWLEYTIRHQGLSYTRTSSFNLSWYQKLYLDIFIFVFLLVFTLNVIFKRLCNYLKDYRIRFKVKFNKRKNM